MIDNTAIVVLTPIKNEDWILEEFLTVTSMFADIIIVADQGSTDNSKSIIERFPKAHYILNDTLDLDDGYRQNLLIETSRKLVSGRKLLLALDADEMLAYASIYAEEWSTICQQAAGTRIYMRKPDLLQGCKMYVDYTEPFLLGYIDDGKPHIGKKFHSPRLPESAIEYFCNDLIVLHFALVRDKEYRARQRLYSVLENIDNSSSLQVRYRRYSRIFQQSRIENKIKKTPESWVNGYLAHGINLTNFQSSEFNNYNKQILEKIQIYGSRRFWLEDIWYVDYREISTLFPSQNSVQISKPPSIINFLRSVFILAFRYLILFKQTLLTKRNNVNIK